MTQRFKRMQHPSVHRHKNNWEESPSVLNCFTRCMRPSYTHVSIQRIFTILIDQVLFEFFAKIEFSNVSLQKFKVVWHGLNMSDFSLQETLYPVLMAVETVGRLKLHHGIDYSSAGDLHTLVNTSRPVRYFTIPAPIHSSERVAKVSTIHPHDSSVACKAADWRNPYYSNRFGLCR